MIAWDMESYRMGPFQLSPKLVCSSWAWGKKKKVKSKLLGNGDKDLWDRIWAMIEGDEELVAHNAAFDLALIAANDPRAITRIFDLLEAGQVHCTSVREKLLNLSSFGLPETKFNPDGTSHRISYKLVDLAKEYLAVDRSADKEGEDIWRLNYDRLDGYKASQYPTRAREYALNDAVDCLGVYRAQERRRKAKDLSVKTESFQLASNFALFLCSAWGFEISNKAKAKIQERVGKLASLKTLPLLVTSGLVAPAEPALPYASGALEHAEDCSRKKSRGEWLCSCPPKLKKAVDEKRNMKLLKAKVETICERLKIEVPMTDPSGKFPDGAVKTDKETIKRLAPHDKVLIQYQERQKWQKILTTELPRMGDIGLMHPAFDPIKETGRTSSYDGGKKGKGVNEVQMWPSGNIQNVDPQVRPCYRPRKGYVLCSVDVKAMELVSAGQKCFDLFGYSVMRDILNAGIDPHCYLGSQLAYVMDDDFKKACRKAKAKTVMKVYKFFMKKKHGDAGLVKDVKKGQKEDSPEVSFYKHWRKFAKPVGLGYPGGLGPATFIDLAAGYGFSVDLATAELLRDVWLQTFPEFKDYFKWINTKCKDERNRDKKGKPKYWYTSPMGMVRRGATYCAAANGAALQTPGAEGAKLAMFNVQRECYDPSLNSCLLGCRVVAFIHDEILIEIPEDEYMHERAYRVSAIMVASLRAVLPDMNVEAEPALMLRWDKSAETVFDGNNRLAIWRPEKKKAA